MNLRHLVTLLALAALAGCGADTMSAAATAAALKKQELEQGHKTMEQAKEKIDQAMQLERERAIAGQ
jgi:outer membrane biogenesis lipoprotein LolB